jgi:uncharacterized SAM-binding protein YcdF (DUF218 family)
MDVLGWTTTNLIAALILPPGVLFVLLAAGLFWGVRYRWGRWLAAGSLVVFALLSLNVVAYALVRPFESRWPPLDPAIAKGLKPAPAVIVVLGGGRTLGALEYPEQETLRAASLRRTIYAARLSEQMGLPLAVSGGKPGGGVLGEADLMNNLLQKGMKQKVILVENASFDTRQNALYTAKALERRDIRSVVLVTDVTHMSRAKRAFEAAGLKVVPAPVHFQASAPLNVTDFIPSIDGLELSRNVLRELVGALWYSIQEAIG